MDWIDDTEWGDSFGEESKYKSHHKITEQAIEARAIKRRLSNDALICRMINNLEQLCDEPRPGEQWRIVTEKQFNAFALVSRLLCNRTIEEMYLAVYRINEPTVDTIIEYVDAGKIKNATFVISSFFNQTKKPEKWAIKLKEYADTRDNCHHCYTHNHSKILAVKCSDGSYFVFEGSGNMSDNARIEQYLYENNKETFDFHKRWMAELAEKTNKKSRR